VQKLIIALLKIARTLYDLCVAYQLLIETIPGMERRENAAAAIRGIYALALGHYDEAKFWASRALNTIKSNLEELDYGTTSMLCFVYKVGTLCLYTTAKFLITTP